MQPLPVVKVVAVLLVEAAPILAVFPIADNHLAPANDAAVVAVGTTLVYPAVLLLSCSLLVGGLAILAPGLKTVVERERPRLAAGIGTLAVGILFATAAWAVSRVRRSATALEVCLIVGMKVIGL